MSCDHGTPGRLNADTSAFSMGAGAAAASSSRGSLFRLDANRMRARSCAGLLFCGLPAFCGARMSRLGGFLVSSVRGTEPLDASPDVIRAR